MAANITQYDTSSSAIWPTRKSALRKYFEDQLVTGGDMAPTKKHIRAAGEGLRAGGESLLVGGVLGALHSHLKTGLDVKQVPVDAVAGVMGLVAGTFAAEEEVGKDLANAGAACLAIFSFRKTQDLVAEMKLKQAGITSGGGASSGQIKIGKTQFGFDRSTSGIIGKAPGRAANHFGEDPIVTAARGL